MDLNYLVHDEFLVECQVRNLQGTAIETYNLLKAQLAAELVTPVLIPNRAHPTARKNPKREIVKCKAKLHSIKTRIQELDKATNKDDYSKIYSRLLHVEGRVQRISRSRSIKEFIPEIQGIVDSLKDCLNKWHTDNDEDADDSVLNATLLNITIDGPSEENLDSESDLTDDNLKKYHLDKSPPVKKISLDNSLKASSSKDFTATVPLETNTPPTLPQESSNEPDKLDHLIHLITERMEKFGNPLLKSPENKKANDNLLPEKPRDVQDKPENSIPNLCHGHSHKNVSFNPASAVPNANVWSHIPPSTSDDFRVSNSSSKHMYKWNLTFDGSSTEKTDVERFLYRVERSAVRYNVSLISLVEELGALLRGEALEWYWLFLERNGSVSWAQLRAELIRRFQRHLTEDDILQELDNRKQRLPKESFYDFYSALIKIAMKSPTPISEDELFRYVKKNMRPGLQFHLQMTDKKINTIDQLIALCVSWEQTWNRNGYCPENFLQHKKSIHELAPFHNSSDASFLPSEVDPTIEAYNFPKKSKTSAIDYSKSPPTGNNPNSAATPNFHIVRNSNPICWNCCDIGHCYQDCSVPPTHIFCYGCGVENVTKPNCLKCNPTNSGNLSMEMRATGRTHFQRPMQPSSNNTNPLSQLESDRLKLLTRTGSQTTNPK